MYGFLRKKKFKELELLCVSGLTHMVSILFSFLIIVLLFKEVDFIENLMCDVLPYSLTKISGSKITMAELDKYRAGFLANILKLKLIK